MKLKFKKLMQVLKKLGPITVASFIVWLVIFVVFIFTNFKARYESISDNIEYETKLTALSTAQCFQKFLTDMVFEIDTTRACIEEKRYDGCTDWNIKGYFQRRTTKLNASATASNYIFYGVIDGKLFDGKNWAISNPEDLMEREWYKMAMEQEGEMVYISPYVDLRTDKTVVTLSKALSDKSGVIAMDIDANIFCEIAARDFAGDIDGIIIVIDNDGNVVAHSNFDEMGKNYSQENGTLGKRVYDEWKNSIINDEPVWIEYEDNNYMLGACKINEEWTVLTLIDSNESFKSLIGFMNRSLILFIIGPIFIFVVMLIIAGNKLKSEEFYENLICLSKSYMSMHKIDLEFDTFQEINCTENKLRHAIGKNHDDANNKMRKVMTKFTAEQSKKSVLEFVNLEDLPEKMGDSDVITIEFLGDQMHWMRGRFVVSERKSDGRIKSVIWTVESIDKEKRESERLRYLAETDTLTGIMNRGGGEAKVSEYILKYEGIFVLFDVDKFKSINDTFGHRVGDNVLVEVAKSMQNAFREDDVVMRLGGDEFAAFAKNVHTKEEADLIIERLFHNIDAIKISNLKDLSVTISVGVTFCNPKDNPLFSEIYKRADSGTYKSKEVFGNKATYYES